MNTYRLSICDRITKSYGMESPKTARKIKKDAQKHLIAYNDALTHSLNKIITSESCGILSVESYSLQPDKIQLMPYAQFPIKIPFIMKEKYHSYYQFINIHINVKLTNDVNYLKLKNFKLYNQLFLYFNFDNQFVQLKREAIDNIKENIETYVRIYSIVNRESLR